MKFYLNRSSNYSQIIRGYCSVNWFLITCKSNANEHYEWAEQRELRVTVKSRINISAVQLTETPTKHFSLMEHYCRFHSARAIRISVAFAISTSESKFTRCK